MARISATQRNFIMAKAVAHMRKVFRVVVKDDLENARKWSAATKLSAIDVFELVQSGEIKLGKKPKKGVDFSSVGNLFDAAPALKRLRAERSKDLEKPFTYDNGTSLNYQSVAVNTFKQCDRDVERVYLQSTIDRLGELNAALDDLYEELMIGDLEEAKVLLATVTEKY